MQWDVAVEFGLLEGAMGPGSAVPLEQITPALVRCVDRVPAEVPVGLHLCYGDYGHQHFTQPESLQMQVDLANAVGRRRAAAGRLGIVHRAPGPRRRRLLRAAPRPGRRPETELAFALVPYHPDDQADGTTATQVGHIDAALAESSAGGREWGVCTECGMGRVAVEDVPRLLDLHHEIITA